MSRKIVLATVFCLTSSLLPGQQQLRSDQPHDSGRSVTPAFEGWFANAAGLDPLWEVSPFLDTTGNTPPFIGFHEKGPFVQGPRGQSQTLSAAVGVPLELPVWVADDASVIPGAARPPAPPIVVTWEK